VGGSWGFMVSETKWIVSKILLFIWGGNRLQPRPNGGTTAPSARRDFKITAHRTFDQLVADWRLPQPGPDILLRPPLCGLTWI
jgi:hypothetical protein